MKFKSKLLGGKDQRGQGMVEFALVLPVLCGIILMLVVIGDVFRRIESIENAASEGGRAAQVWRPDGIKTCLDVAQAAANAITPFDIQVIVSDNCSASGLWDRVPSGSLITVRVTHEFEPIFFSTLLLGRNEGDPPYVLSYSAQVEDRHE